MAGRTNSHTLNARDTNSSRACRCTCTRCLIPSVSTISKSPPILEFSRLQINLGGSNILLRPTPLCAAKGFVPSINELKSFSLAMTSTRDSCGISALDIESSVLSASLRRDKILLLAPSTTFNPSTNPLDRFICLRTGVSRGISAIPGLC